MRTALLVIGIPLVVAIIVAIVAGGMYASNLSYTFDSTKKFDVAEVFPEEEARPAVTVPASQNILLMGSDTRGTISDNIDEVIGDRSDTMMVVHIAANRKNVHVMSIMRDSWVEIPGHGTAKLNAALSLGGVPLVVQVVESLISSRIDRVAVVDFAGFAGLTDALGGVRVDNPVAFTAKEGGHTYTTGPIELNGNEALGFVREPKEHTDSDYQRVKNQQLFLKSALNKTLSAETLTNPVTINNLVASITPFLTLDSGFTSAYAAGLAFELRDIRMEDVTFFTMPTVGIGREGKQSVVYIDWEQLVVLQQHFRDDSLTSFNPS
ncbi:LCP family protein [Mycetocola sp. 2940]|uniref:LCP family protein n=1 Tax=Mycetocola sp. 2940 TaxID=3156452 RepID=UPI003396C0DE